MNSPIASWNEKGDYQGKAFQNHQHLLVNSGNEKLCITLIHKCANTLLKRNIADEMKIDRKNPDFLNTLKAQVSIENFTPEQSLCIDFAFIYRDPIERFISTYIDKMIFKRGNTGIIKWLKSHNKDTELSFREFLELTLDTKTYLHGDPHLRQQRCFLLPRYYKYAIEMSTLGKMWSKIPVLKSYKRDASIKANQTYRLGTKELPLQMSIDLINQKPILLKSYLYDYGSENLISGLKDPHLLKELKNAYMDDYRMYDYLQSKQSI